MPLLMSAPSVILACAEVRNAADDRVWSAPASASVCAVAGAMSVWLTMVT